ncbi:MAG: RHS repeat-associated core domain-containing protein, partial [Phycisphaeraceae bacterium]|nr:RHS repeat-associated core domain-containing protein [Phycisphaeraceae bacterium]
HAQYLWCPSYIDTPVLRWRDTSEVPDQELDETLYYTVDANKNVTALIDATTGNVVERYLYDPYGRVMVLDDGWDSIAWSASKKNEILFTGYRWNPETGYYQARNREYHPLLGRFLQRDPLGHVDGGNIYAGYFVMWGGVDSLGLSVDGECIVTGIRHRSQETSALLLVWAAHFVGNSPATANPQGLLARRYFDLFECCKDGVHSLRWGKESVAVGIVDLRERETARYVAVRLEFSLRLHLRFDISADFKFATEVGVFRDSREDPVAGGHVASLRSSRPNPIFWARPSPPTGFKLGDPDTWTSVPGLQRPPPPVFGPRPQRFSYAEVLYFRGGNQRFPNPR